MNTPGIRDEETRKISGWEEKILGDYVRTLVPAQPQDKIKMQNFNNAMFSLILQLNGSLYINGL